MKGSTDLFNSFLCSLLRGESNKGISSVETSEGFHHEPEVPDDAALLEEGHQLIFKHIFRDFASKDL